MSQHVENTGLTSDHLYLEASIHSAQSQTGFKVSVLRGNVRFRLSRSYRAQSIQVEMVGFKSVRVVQRQNVNMNSGVDVKDVSERLCVITWDIAEDMDLEANREYSFDFSALLDARLPRSIKAGNSKVYYRLSADIPKLHNIKTETRLNIPWSRYCAFEPDPSEIHPVTSSVHIEDKDDMVLEYPNKAIKGPDRTMTVRMWPTRSPQELHLTHISLELLQDVSMNLSRLREPHAEPASAVYSHKCDIPSTCSQESPLSLEIPLPVEIHAQMASPHMTVTHTLKVTIHRSGVRGKRTHREPMHLYHIDLDKLDGRPLQMYEDVLTREHNNPVYEYNSLDRKYADEQHNVL